MQIEEFIRPTLILGSSNLDANLLRWGRRFNLDRDQRKTDLEALIEIITRQNITISVGHNLRHHPSVDFGMKCITGGVLGDISSVVSIGASYLPNWRPGQNFKHNYAADPIAGGVLFDWVHEIDLLFYLVHYLFFGGDLFLFH